MESGDIYKEKMSLEEGQKQEANGIVSGWEEGELHAPLAAQSSRACCALTNLQQWRTLTPPVY